MEDKTPISIEQLEVLFNLYGLHELIKKDEDINVKHLPHPKQIADMLFATNEETDEDMIVMVIATWLAFPTLTSLKSKGTGDYIFRLTARNCLSKEKCQALTKLAKQKFKNLLQEKKRYDKQYGKNTIIF